MTLSLLIPAFVALLVSSIAVPALASWARSRQLLDVPNDRSSHTRPTPRVGGVGILFGVGAGIAASALLGSPRVPHFALLSSGAVAIALLSVVDDIRSLPASLRLPVHVAIAAVVVIGTGDPAFAGRPISLATLTAIVWIVGMVNAYNFMDGIDGIAGGQAVVAALGWAVVGYLAGSDALLVLAVMLTASVIAFLKWNWQPARVFMGDAGSAFLGYTFAVLPLALAPARTGLWIAAAFFLWAFVFDTSFTLLRRLQRRENVFRAHRSHLYQRLVATGATHRQISLVYMALAALGLPAGILAAQGSASAIAVLCTASVGIAALMLWTETVRRENSGAAERRGAVGHVR